MPRRHDDLFAGVASFAALRAAARRAVRGKRRKPGASAFFANLERELLCLEGKLRAATYRPGRYVEIKIRDPKERIVSAAPIRDRVVHHALCAVICPLFERGFIGNTFANRVGKGTHRAIDAYEAYRGCHAHVLRCDLFRYFPLIDHAILKAEFRRRIACAQTPPSPAPRSRPRWGPGSPTQRTRTLGGCGRRCSGAGGSGWGGGGRRAEVGHLVGWQRRVLRISRRIAPCPPGSAVVGTLRFAHPTPLAREFPTPIGLYRIDLLVFSRACLIKAAQ